LGNKNFAYFSFDIYGEISGTDKNGRDFTYKYEDGEIKINDINQIPEEINSIILNTILREEYQKGLSETNIKRVTSNLKLDFSPRNKYNMDNGENLKVDSDVLETI